MSFRDSFRAEENNNSYSAQNFHPVRDLIDSVIETVREGRERRMQARMEREMARQGGAFPELNDSSNPVLKHDRHANNDQRRNRHDRNDRQDDYNRVPVSPQPYERPQVNNRPANTQSYDARQANLRPGNPQPSDARQVYVRPATTDSRPIQVTPISTNVGTRGRIDYVSQPGGSQARASQTEEPPLAEPIAQPKEAPGTEPADTTKEEQKVAEIPAVTEKIFPDIISIKEKNGFEADVAEDKNASTDKRLAAYLSERGNELTELNVNGSALSNDGLNLLKSAPNLNRLMLNDCEVDNKSMEVLGKQGLKNLTDLNLHSTRVGDDGVAHLKAMPLTKLNLSDTVVTDDVMKHLKEIKTLQSVNFDYSMVGNEAIKALKDMPNLRSISLKGTSLNDDAVVDLAKARQLMVLNIEDTKISAEKVQWLKTAMPNTVITSDAIPAPTQGRKGHQENIAPHKPFKWLTRPFGGAKS